MVFFLFSHAIADGMAGIGLLLKLVDNSPIDPLLPMNKQPKKEGDKAVVLKRKKKPQLGAFSKTNAFVGGIKKGLSVSVPIHDPKNTLKLKAKNVFNEEQYTGLKKFAKADAIDLQEIKDIKNKFKDATVNDVFMALMTITVRSFLEEIGDPILKKKNKIRGSIPVSRRAKNEALLKGGEPKNNWEPLTFRLPLDYKTPAGCVWKVKRIIDREKVSPALIVQRKVAGTSVKISPRKFILKQIVKATTRATLMLSNVPGPQQPVYIKGKEVEEIDFFLSAPIGTYMGVFTYNGKVTLSVNSDKDLDYDPEDLVKHWTQAFATLKEDVEKYEDKVPKNLR